MDNIPQEELPPKDEVYLFTKLSETQKQMYKNLMSRTLAADPQLDNKSNYINISMQLRWICNHPDIVTGNNLPDKIGPDFAVNVIKNSGKMIVLDRLLEKLHKEKRQAVIFSEMPNMLKILEQYCGHKNYKYSTMNKWTKAYEKEKLVNDFSKPGSDIFLFLLPTDLASPAFSALDTAIFYDRDWNLRMNDLSSSKVHHAKQKNPVTIYRMVAEGTLEEKFIEMAKEKVEFYDMMIDWHSKGYQGDNDAVVVELFRNLILYGTDKILSEEGSGLEDFGKQVAEMGIEEYLENSKIKTSEFNSKFEKKDD